MPTPRRLAAMKADYKRPPAGAIEVAEQARTGGVHRAINDFRAKLPALYVTWFKIDPPAKRVTEPAADPVLSRAAA